VSLKNLLKPNSGPTELSHSKLTPLDNNACFIASALYPVVKSPIPFSLTNYFTLSLNWGVIDPQLRAAYYNITANCLAFAGNEAVAESTTRYKAFNSFHGSPLVNLAESNWLTNSSS
jgi:hypothetical protein